VQPPREDARQLLETSKRFARRLLAAGENRFELLMVELQEGHERLLCAILLAVGVGTFGLLAAATLTAAIVVLLWELSRVAALLALTGLYTIMAFCLYRRLKRLLRDLQNLPATLEQLRKDRACLEKHLK